MAFIRAFMHIFLHFIRVRVRDSRWLRGKRRCLRGSKSLAHVPGREWIFDLVLIIFLFPFEYTFLLLCWERISRCLVILWRRDSRSSVNHEKRRRLLGGQSVLLLLLRCKNQLLVIRNNKKQTRFFFLFFLCLFHLKAKTLLSWCGITLVWNRSVCCPYSSSGVWFWMSSG